jgi:hypothetical protein
MYVGLCIIDKNLVFLPLFIILATFYLIIKWNFLDLNLSFSVPFFIYYTIGAKSINHFFNFLF